MLTKCKECGGQLSTEAIMCPHCGFSNDKNSTKLRKNRRKHVRLPNGFGQISKISGNLRNPYRAMVTIGKSPEGKPICRILKPKGYFKTYREAYEALIKYHDNPYDLSSNLTCKGLYEKWSSVHYPTIGRGYKNYETAWKFCSLVYDLPVSDLKAKHIKQCMLEGRHNNKTAAPSTQIKIKQLFNVMLNYAVENEVVSTNCAQSFTTPKSILDARKDNYKGHKSFTIDELKILSKSTGNPHVRLVLINCYLGCRPGELLTLETDKLSFDNWTIIGGSKTEAGRERTMPIHEAIRPMVKECFDDAVSNNRKYLFGNGKTGISYTLYRTWLKGVLESLGLSDHSAHDCRKTFVTLAKEFGVDEYAIKRIVGHKIKDLTEDVYTERTAEWLNKEVAKIPNYVGIV